ncbi:bifunctional diguanylate cyclase/phosphodiesterase [Paenibacillus periandrae]|uniref:bifunctional diguanylate cyclase/phosphodiesterase n=1 Tax=Paenibacillus periandrae TaxID=1761741 RepID=UPI001F08ABFB|nr:bifunctional diguanylate cyclase/phosphodiesterase [Paenibacillus periandrae]
MEHLHGTYNPYIVIISYIIAGAASYSALDLAGTISFTKGKTRALWLICGASLMGLGIWSMHFVGMLAFSLQMKVTYHTGLVVLSVVLAIAVSYIALYIVSSNEQRVRQLITGGVCMAAGICGMHYVGMAAMMVDITYNFWLVGLSILVAVVASSAALWLLFYFRENQSRYIVLYKLISGLVMGVAIAGMHYIGMAAAEFYHGEKTVIASGLLIEQGILAYIIAAGTLITIGFTLFGIYVNKRLSHKDSTILEHERWYHSLYENNSNGIVSVDIHGNIMGFNRAVTQITGLEEADFINKHISHIGLQITEEERENTKKFYYESFKKQPQSYETALIANGKRFDLSIINVPVEIKGRLVGNHIIAKDITEEKQSKEMAQHLAYHDELTGLPNRRRFNQVLAEAIEAAQGTDLNFAVMVLDIDRFKIINDSLGHTYGDIFLQEMCERIRTSVENYKVTLARIGGDEFTLVCDNSYDESKAIEIAERIIQAVQLPYRLKDNDFYITASIGIAIYPQHGADDVQLLKHADTAMYEVKKNGKNGYLLFTSKLDYELQEKIELESDLRKAIERNEFLLYYQPQIRPSDNCMIGVEALVRWMHPTKGMLPPGMFISIAEETGMIYELGTWVLREACAQMRAWHDSGGPLIPVSVNLSSQQFHQTNLVTQIKKILEETRLEPQYLELEITESMMMDASISSEILNELSDSGIRISLDDFGTGYSSLSYLKLYPIHKLKIDRSFITDITSDDNDRAIVATIISMAKHLNMEVIAEGIETKDQLDILLDNECQEIQGFYYSKPLSAGDVEQAFFVPMRIQSFQASEQPNGAKVW